MKPTVGSTPPWAGVTPAPSEKRAKCRGRPFAQSLSPVGIAAIGQPCSATKRTPVRSTLILSALAMKKVLIVALIAMLACASAAPRARAEQSAPTATPVPNFSGFPEQAPPGWDAKLWAHTRERCNHIAAKSRAGKPLNMSEFTFSQTCTSLSIELFNPQLRGSDQRTHAGHVPPSLLLGKPTSTRRDRVPQHGVSQKSNWAKQSLLVFCCLPYCIV